MLLCRVAACRADAAIVQHFSDAREAGDDSCLDLSHDRQAASRTHLSE